MFVLFASLLIGNAELCHAGAFLRAAPPAQSDFVDTRDVKQLLESALSGPALHRVSLIEEHLRPIYTALPKGSHGKLEPAAVRYALHRYFVQEHGWYMKGLEATSVVVESPSAVILKDRAPMFIQSQFDEHSRAQGLGLHELAAFASILSDLVHKEAAGSLHGVFKAMDVPTDGNVSGEAVLRTLKAYLMRFLAGDVLLARLFDDGMDESEVESIVGVAYPAWTEVFMFMTDLHAVDGLAQQARRNPFVEVQPTFDDAARFVQEFSHHFGDFQNLECKALKQSLLDMEYRGTGRVPLAAFYQSELKSSSGFAESTAYLRHLGVLDETDPTRPTVVIPNYVVGPSNCLTSSGFYSVCCKDECGDLLGHLEQEIAAPFAFPARIIELVSGMSSDTVDAPRNLSKTLVSRLHSVAEHHGGVVPLHGRLFAQWMHHAYPRECPFPHAGMTARPKSPEEWIADNRLVKASRGEMRTQVAEYRQLDVPVLQEDDLEDLPWTDVEEMLPQDAQMETESALLSFNLLVRAFMALAVLVSFAAPLVRSAKLSRTESEEKVERFMV